jgi:hypothetical protein
MLIRRIQIGWYAMRYHRSSPNPDSRDWQTVMEQSVSAANAKMEAFKKGMSSIETELWRTRVSRTELEGDLAHVSWNIYD